VRNGPRFTQLRPNLDFRKCMLCYLDLQLPPFASILGAEDGDLDEDGSRDLPR
jgi:hypothetical protein